VINQNRLTEFLNFLVDRGIIHSGQKQDVLNRGQEQARHLLLDKRTEMRRLMGRKRVAYSLSEIEVIASFRFRRMDITEELVDEECISRVIAEEKGYPFVVLDPLQLDYRLVTDSFGGPFAERHLIITLELDEDSMTLAMAEPWNKEIIHSIERIKGKKIIPITASKRNVLRVIAEFHGFRSSMRAAEAKYGNDRYDLGNLEQLHILATGENLDGTDQPVVQAVWYLLNYAFDNRASDIHIEPKRHESWVRMRIDGVLHSIHRMPRVVHPAVLSRLKTLSRLDIAERRRPQDGRFKTKYNDNEVELRISTAPTAFGEKLVARIFDPGVLIQDIDNLGFFSTELEKFKQMVTSNTGLILVVGPTGSGKTTTLYSSLHYVASPRINVITLEDPIEMVHEKFNQIAMQPKIGLTFGSALRTVLRQDPDVVMVGEIRDQDTAQNVLQAAMTGHTVISTIHTGEASGAISRMLDLDVMPFLLSGVLVGVVAQRLVRKVCPFCAIDDVLTDDQIHSLRIQNTRGRKLKVKRGKGCIKCRYTGYLGRTGLFEVLEVTPRIQRLINERAATQEIKREALNDGMLTLREYGIKKIALGLTTPEEVLSLTDEHKIY
jgi:general secretion pathway protein E